MTYLTTDQLFAFILLLIIGRTFVRAAFYLACNGFDNPVEFIGYLI